MTARRGTAYALFALAAFTGLALIPVAAPAETVREPLATGTPSPVVPLPLQMATEESPPLNFRQGTEVVGIAVDLLRWTAVAADIPIEIRIMPWMRAYRQAEVDERSCVFATAMTEERRPRFKWVAPLLDTEWVLVARPEFKTALETLEAARVFRVGVYNGDIRHKTLERLGGFRLSVAYDDAGSLRNLLRHRIDLWFTDRSTLSWFARKPEANALRIVYRAPKTPLGIACNPGVPDAEIGRLNSALARLREDGAFEAVARRYGGTDGPSGRVGGPR